MIDLRAGLGAPPTIYPGVTLPNATSASFPNTVVNAPVMQPSQAAAQRTNLGCVGCANGAPVALSGLGVGDLQSWWDKIPLWLKIVGGAAVFSGVAYGVYRLVR